MDRPTDPQTDKPSYRDAWTHLKMLIINPPQVVVIDIANDAVSSGV